MHLISGDTLKNLETDVEAIYVAALPTVGAGAIHLLQEGERYFFKFAHDLTDQYAHTHRGDAPVGATATSDITGAPQVGIDPAKLDRLLALLEAQSNAGAQAPAQETPGVQPTTPSPATEASSPGVAVTGVPVPGPVAPDGQPEPSDADLAAFRAWQAQQQAPPVAPSFPAGPAFAPTPPDAPPTQ